MATGNQPNTVEPTRISRSGDPAVTEAEIEAKVIEIVANQMGADKSTISRNTSFVDDLNADSLDTVELVMEFEDAFEIDIPDEQAEKIKTVGQAIDFIKQDQKQDQAS
jgi:acyl carrier protein